MTAPIDLRTSTNPADREIDALRARVETPEAALRAEKDDRAAEVDEFNAGVNAAITTDETEPNEPSGTKYDVWLIGWAWGKYCKELVKDLRRTENYQRARIVVEPVKPAAPLSAFAIAHAAVIKDKPTPAEWATFEALKQQDLSSHAKTGKDERQGRK